MSVLAPSSFVITTAGLAAASSAGAVVITKFQLGSGYGYTPASSDTALHGTIVLPNAVPSADNRVSDDTRDIVCVLPAVAGPFQYGEIGLYLADGTLFALAAYSALQTKVTSSVNGVANALTFHCLLRFGTNPALIEVNPATPGVAATVADTSYVTGPALMSGMPNALLVNETVYGGSNLFLTKATAAKWAVQNFSPLASGSLISLASGNTDVSSSAFFGLTVGSPAGTYVIQDSLGNVRLASANATSGHLTLSKPMPNGTTTATVVTVYEADASRLDRLALNVSTFYVRTASPIVGSGLAGDPLQLDYAALRAATLPTVSSPIVGTGLVSSPLALDITALRAATLPTVSSPLTGNGLASNPLALDADSTAGLVMTIANPSYFRAGFDRSGVLAGTIMFSAAPTTSTLPPGFLRANGAAVNRVTYAALYAAIGTFYGAGDGSTTFALPDMRGEFIRGWDDGRGVDPGRAPGTWQADDFKSHTHTQAGPFGARFLQDSGGYGSNPQQTGATGGSETRPRNLAFIALIKY